MAQISFSIVVVCLNPGEKLLKTVQSVLNQKYGNYEIVVKDGGRRTAPWNNFRRTAESGFIQDRTVGFMTR